MSPIGSQMQVVVVEDDDDIRTLVSIALELDGRFDVVASATSAREAVREVTRVRPDAVLLDLTLPDAAGDKGLEVLAEMCRASPESAVVVFSGRADEGLEGRVLAAGGRALVTKGGDSRTVVDALLTVLAADAAVRAIEPGTEVTVRSTFSRSWQDGFVVSRADDAGYWLERRDGSTLPAPVDRTRVRANPQHRQ